jgi:hypothetical protein
MPGDVALTVDLPAFAARLRAVTGGQRPADAAAEDAAVLAALDGYLRPVLRAPWPETPELGWPGRALDRLVEMGQVSTLACRDRRLWMLRGIATHQNGGGPFPTP